ncbi:MAG: PaaI family thioesterase [Armatimonadota bacterium]|nr:PaaI family thioesterase [bacterium]
MSEISKLDNDDGCFVCGKSNPIGLKLDFAMEGDEYVTYFTPQKEHQGWVGITHGGIVCTVLDEVMTRFVHDQGNEAVTGEITVRLKRPALIGARLRFAGKIESDSPRVIGCSGRATDESGNVIAEATAKVVRIKK